MVDWLLFLTRETTFVTSSLTSGTQPPYENTFSLKGKGSKFFPMNVDPFVEGNKNNLGRVVTLESVSIPKGSKFLPFRVDPFAERRKNNFKQVVSLRVSILIK